MTTTTPTAPAPAPALDAERADLIDQLSEVRAALVRTVAGLTDAQAGERPTVSALCLGGLVKHVTAAEESWVRFAATGEPAMSWDLPEGVTWEDLVNGTARTVPQWMLDHADGFRLLPGETLAGVLDRYAEVAAATETAIAAIPDLSAAYAVPDAPWQTPGTVYTARRMLTHVIAETAQHAGHADIIRETLDGATAS